MHESPTDRRFIIVSPHALVRYRQRFDPAATEETLAGLVRAATLAPSWVRKACYAGDTHRAGRAALVAGETVLIVAEDGWHTIVVTVVALECYRGRQKKIKPPARHGRHSRNRA